MKLRGGGGSSRLLTTWQAMYRFQTRKKEGWFLMKDRLLRAFTVIALAGLLLFQSSASTSTARAFDYSHLTKMQRRLLSGMADLEINPQSAAIINSARQTAAAAVNTPQVNAEASGRLKNYFPGPNGYCPLSLGDNI